jgi:hypothetical protein
MVEELLKESSDQVSFMRREVVQDQHGSLIRQVGRNNLLQETNEFLSGVARGVLPDYLAVSGFKAAYSESVPCR